MRLFGKSKKKTTQTPMDSIISMRTTLEVLEKKEKHLDTKIVQEQALARQHAVSNKSMALMAIKRRKMYEAQREHTRGARFNLETQILTIENANVNYETLNAMKTGAKAMRGIHGEMDIDKVDDAMDEVREQMDIANEISTAISTPLGIDLGVDEEELEAELEQLEQEQLDASLLDTRVRSNQTEAAVASPPAAASATSKSTSSIPAINSEEAELEELRASMAL